MSTYKKFLNILSLILRDLSALIITVMIGTYFFEIVRRTFWHKSFMWIQELNVILVVWLVFMGASHVYLSSELIRVDFLHNKTRGLVRLIWTLVIYAVSLFVLYFFLVQGYKYMIHMLPTKTNILKVSYLWYALPMVISAVIMILGLIAKVYDAFIEFKDHRNEKSTPVPPEEVNWCG